jgi:glutathionyl-hydroquinone reductase
MADWLYLINNGVYQCGFAPQTQEAYNKAATLAANQLDACNKELLND